MRNPITRTLTPTPPMEMNFPTTQQGHGSKPSAGEQRTGKVGDKNWLLEAVGALTWELAKEVRSRETEPEHEVHPHGLGSGLTRMDWTRL